jgi:hypothetical protein
VGWAFLNLVGTGGQQLGKTEAMVPKALYGYFYRLFGTLVSLSRQIVGWTSTIMLLRDIFVAR